MAALRVLQVVTSTDRRGAETFAVDLMQVLEDRGFRVETVALAPGSTGGLPVTPLGRRPLAVGTLAALRKSAQDANVVIAHGSSTLPACALGLAGTRTPFVYRNIGDPRFWGNTRLRRARVALFLTRSQCVVALTHAASRSLHSINRVPDSKLRVIPTGVDAARLSAVTTVMRQRARQALGIDPRARVATVVAALSREKGVDLAIRAATRAHLDLLIIAGDGPARQDLEAQAAREVPGGVRFLGSVDDPTEAYAAADVVVLPSRTEGLPAVLIEAGMHALPTVTTDVGYARDIVADGDTGIVVPPEDVGALARGIIDALALDEGAKGRARARCVARFDLGVVADAWADALHAVGAP